jgi:WD40 repeat protein
VNPDAHTDFIKCLLVLPGLDVLVSGGSDKDIRLWDLRATQSWDLLKIEASAPPTDCEEADISDKIDEQDRDRGGRQPGSKSSASAYGSASSSSSRAPVFTPLPFFASLRAHTRPVECLDFHRITVPPSTREEENEELQFTGRLALWSADTMGTVTLWEVWREASGDLRTRQGASWRGHETGIYDLVVGDGEVWTGIHICFFQLSRHS